MEEKFELNGKLPEVKEMVPVCLGDINNSIYIDMVNTKVPKLIKLIEI